MKQNNTKTRKSIVIIAMLVLVTFVMLQCFLGCSSGDGDDGGGSVDPTQSPIPTFSGVANDNATPLPESVEQQFEGVEGDTYYYNSSASDIANLKPGDVIIGENNEGYLRKVVSVKLENGKYAVDTEQANLEDVFVSTEKVTFSRELSPADVVQEKCSDGVKIRHNKNQRGFNIEFDEKIYEDEVTLQFKGSYNWTPSIKEMSFQYEDSILKFCSFQVNSSQSASLGLFSGLGVQKKWEKELYSATLSPIVVPVAGIPLVFVPELKVKAGFNTSLQGGMKVEGTYSTSQTAGIVYENGAWNKVNEYEKSANGTFQPEASAEAKLFLKPEITLKCYGVAGPYLNVEPYLKGTATVKPRPCFDWNVLFGVSANVGVDVKVFSRKIADAYYELINYEWPITSGSTCTSPTPEPSVSPSPSPEPSISPIPSPSPEPPVPIVVGTWDVAYTWTSGVAGNYNITFSEDGTFQANEGDNSYNGTWLLEGEEIKWTFNVDLNTVYSGYIRSNNYMEGNILNNDGDQGEWEASKIE